MTKQEKVRQHKAKYDNFSASHDKVKKGKTKQTNTCQLVTFQESMPSIIKIKAWKHVERHAKSCTWCVLACLCKEKSCLDHVL